MPFQSRLLLRKIARERAPRTRGEVTEDTFEVHVPSTRVLLRQVIRRDAASDRVSAHTANVSRNYLQGLRRGKHAQMKFHMKGETRNHSAESRETFSPPSSFLGPFSRLFSRRRGNRIWLRGMEESTIMTALTFRLIYKCRNLQRQATRRWSSLRWRFTNLPF